MSKELDMQQVISEWVEADMRSMMSERERRISLVVQPRPRWMPQWLWRRLLARMLVMVEKPMATDKTWFRLDG